MRYDMKSERPINNSPTQRRLGKQIQQVAWLEKAAQPIFVSARKRESASLADRA